MNETYGHRAHLASIWQGVGKVLARCWQGHELAKCLRSACHHYGKSMGRVWLRQLKVESLKLKVSLYSSRDKMSIETVGGIQGEFTQNSRGIQAEFKENSGRIPVDGSKMVRRWLEDGSKMVRRWLEANNLVPHWEQNSPTLGTKQSHTGTKLGLRLVVMLLLLMTVGVGEMWGATITYHIINMGRLDDNGALTSNRTEALQFTSTSTRVEVPSKYKSPLAKNWKYYTSGEITVNEGAYTFAESTTLVEGTDVLSDGDHVYVTYEFNENALSTVGLYDGGVCRIKFPDGYYLKQSFWMNGKIKELNTASANSNTTTSEFLWKFNIIDPYQITVQSKSQSEDNCFDYYLCSKSGNFGDIRLNASLSGARDTKVWVFGLLNGGTSGTYRLVVTDGYSTLNGYIATSPTGLDSYGHGYLNNYDNSDSSHKTRYMKYGGSNYTKCDLTFVPLTKTYNIVNNGVTLVHATTTDYPLEVPDVIKSPLATYTFYSDAACTNELSTLGSTTTIYVKYTTSTDVLNLKGEIKYNISVGGTNYLYAADATSLSSETTNENNGINTHKWTLNGDDAYQITIKNIDNSKEITYDVSSGEAVPTLSGAGSKFFLHQRTSGQYEVVAITANDYSTQNYYTLGLDAGYLKLYSSSSHEFGDTEVQTVFTPRAMATITTPPAANSLTYNGSNQNLVTAGTALNGTMKYRIGDTGSYETTIPAAKDANTYNVYYMASGADGYEDFIASEPIEVTINKRYITISGIAANNRVYDGTTDATLVYTGVSFTGKVDGDNLTVTATGTFENKNVGNDKTVTISDLTLGGTAVGNYTLATTGQQTTATANIIKATITVSGIEAEDKTYDGTTAATLVYTNATLAGKVGNEDLSVSATGTFANKNVGNEKTVTISDLALVGSAVGNYTLATSGQQTSTTATISTKTVTISGITAEDKTYDGTPDATLVMTGATFAEGDIIAGDEVTIVSATATFADKNVGTNKEITITGLGLSGTDAGNYNLNSSGSTSTQANITALEATLSWNENLTYNGTNQAPTATVSNLCGTDDCTVTVTIDGDHAAAGDYTGTVTLEGTDAINYSLSSTSKDFTIAQKTIGLDWSGVSFTYDGNSHAPTATASELVGGDEITVSIELSPQAGSNLTQGLAINAGAYTATASTLTGDDANNYKLPDAKTQNFTIDKKSLGNGTTPETDITYTIEKDEYDQFVITIRQEGKTDPLIVGTEGTDYDYSLNTNGTTTKYYKAAITGANNYEGGFAILYAYVNFQTDANRAEWSGTFVAENAVTPENPDNSKGHKLPEGITAYIITSIEGDWAIPEALDYIPEGVPVLLMSDHESNGFLVEDASGHTPITTGTGEQVDKNMLEVRNAIWESVPAKTIYLLHNNEFVYNMAGDLAAGKVYLNLAHTVPVPSPAPPRLRIKWDAVSGIEELQNDGITETGDETWYTIDGRKLNGKPQERGLYINGGKKVFMK